MREKENNLPGLVGWFQPKWKIWVKIGFIFPKDRGENKKSLKPPSSLSKTRKPHVLIVPAGYFAIGSVKRKQLTWLMFNPHLVAHDCSWTTSAQPQVPPSSIDLSTHFPSTFVPLGMTTSFNASATWFPKRHWCNVCPNVHLEILCEISVGMIQTKNPLDLHFFSSYEVIAPYV